MDHFIGYHEGMPPALRDLRAALKAVVAGGPDAVTMHKGVALGFWGPYAGKVPLIMQSIAERSDDSASATLAMPQDAADIGADVFACGVLPSWRHRGRASPAARPTSFATRRRWACP